jgi:general secretion pathway protein H
MAMAESRKTKNGGFTLVELMVVLVIIGLAAAAVVLTLPERGGSLASEAERFGARAKAARDQAILRSRTNIVQVGQGGYSVAERIDGGWRTGSTFEWAAGTTPDLAGAAAGTIRFDSTGLADPVRLVLRRRGRQVVVDIANDGGIHVVR